MTAFNPTAEEITEQVRDTKFGQSLSAPEREAFARDMISVSKKLPTPPKAALIGAGLGLAVALLSGRSMIKYGVIFGGLGYVGMSLFDVTFATGYAMGYGTGKKGTS